MFVDECVYLFSAKNGIVENSLRILDPCRAPKTDTTNHCGSIKPRLRITDLEEQISSIIHQVMVKGCLLVSE